MLNKNNYNLDTSIHLWSIPLDQPVNVINTLLPLLSKYELQKVKTFHFEKHRNPYIVAHAGLRLLLEKYTKLPSHKLTFKYGSFGKPFLDNVSIPNAVQFNLSHSENKAIVAIGKNQRLGIDIEYIRHIKNHIQIAQRFFTKNEQELLMSYNKKCHQRIFFKIWTQKESLIKATGAGLFQALNKIDTTQENNHFIDETSWKTESIDLFEQYALALAYEGDESIYIHRKLNFDNLVYN